MFLTTEFFNRHSEKDTRRGLRKNMPAPEVVLWSKLRGQQLRGARFRRQYSIGPFVVDFCCPALKLAIEVDGESHFEEDAQAYDLNRQIYIENFGYRMIRFTNREVIDNLEGVLAAIEQVVLERSGDPL